MWFSVVLCDNMRLWAWQISPDFADQRRPRSSPKGPGPPCTDGCRGRPVYDGDVADPGLHPRRGLEPPAWCATSLPRGRVGTQVCRRPPFYTPLTVSAYACGYQKMSKKRSRRGQHGEDDEEDGVRGPGRPRRGWPPFCTPLTVSSYTCGFATAVGITVRKMEKKKTEALAAHVELPSRGKRRASRRLPVILSRDVLPGRGAGGACSHGSFSCLRVVRVDERWPLLSRPPGTCGTAERVGLRCAGS